MAKVKDLIPGDVVVQFPTGLSAVFVGALPHPLYPKLMMVIWQLPTRVNNKHGQWSHDALDAEQDVGTVMHWQDADKVRRENLRRVLGE